MDILLVSNLFESSLSLQFCSVLLTGARMGCILATLGTVQTPLGPQWDSFWPLWALSRAHWGPNGMHSDHFVSCPDPTGPPRGCLLATLGPVQAILRSVKVTLGSVQATLGAVQATLGSVQDTLGDQRILARSAYTDHISKY